MTSLSVNDLIEGDFYKLLVTKCICRKPAVGGKGGDHEFVTINNHEFQGRYLRYSGVRKPTFKFQVSSDFLFMVELHHIITITKMDPKLHPEMRPRNRKGLLTPP